MKYYLGYYDNLEIKPIELEGVATSILSVVRFTTNFDSVNILSEYLFNENKIPHQKVPLCYAIEKGKKGHKYYESLKTENIYTIEYSSLFSIEGIKKFLNEQKYNEEMIILLFSEYLRKYGFTNTIDEYLKSCSINKLVSHLSDISKVTSSFLRDELNYIITNYQTLTSEEIEKLLNYILSWYKNNNLDLVNIFLCLRKSINYINIPTIKYLYNWLSIIKSHNFRGYRPYNTCEEQNINSECIAFLNSIIYDYDNEKHEYKKVDGRKKIQERQLFDLAIILGDYYKKVYDEYLNTIYKDAEDYDEDAEFLCESDFERIGTTSLEAGIKIRKI